MPKAGRSCPHRVWTNHSGVHNDVTQNKPLVDSSYLWLGECENKEKQITEAAQVSLTTVMCEFQTHHVCSSVSLIVGRSTTVSLHCSLAVLSAITLPKCLTSLFHHYPFPPAWNLVSGFHPALFMWKCDGVFQSTKENHRLFVFF